MVDLIIIDHIYNLLHQSCYLLHQSPDVSRHHPSVALAGKILGLSLSMVLASLYSACCLGCLKAYSHHMG